MHVSYNLNMAALKCGSTTVNKESRSDSSFLCSLLCCTVTFRKTTQCLTTAKNVKKNKIKFNLSQQLSQFFREILSHVYVATVQEHKTKSEVCKGASATLSVCVIFDQCVA